MIIPITSISPIALSFYASQSMTLCALNNIDVIGQTEDSQGIEHTFQSKMSIADEQQFFYLIPILFVG